MVYQFIHGRRISALDQFHPSPKSMNLTCVVVRAAHFPRCVLSASTATINVARSSSLSALRLRARTEQSHFPLSIFYIGQLPVLKRVTTSRNFVQCRDHHDGWTLVHSLKELTN